MNDLNPVREFLVAEYPEETITGADLGTMLGQKFGIEYGKFYSPDTIGKLTRFVQDHLAETLIESGRKGLDRIYSIIRPPNGVAGPNKVSTQIPFAQTESLWIEFASPNGLRRIFVSKSNASFRLTISGDAIDADEVEIHRMTTADFSTVAREFVESSNLSQENRESLESATSQSGYGGWLAMLNQISPRTKNEWSAHRVKAIIDSFKRQLNGHGLASDAIEQLVGALEQSRNNAQVAKRQMSGSHPSNLQLRSAGSSMNANEPKQAVSLVRELAHHAIMQMPLLELRDLKMSLGTIESALLEMQKTGKLVASQ